jgi:hypothetical protein
VNLTDQDEIGSYVEEVRQALGGLPPATREELLEDLPEHLAEVLAEGGGTLTGRLGSPSAYAADLIASAGLAGHTEPPRGAFEGVRGRARGLRDRAREAARRADVRVGPLLGYARASEFLTLLRPAWWVLRGYLVAMAITQLFDGNQRIGLLPRLGGSDLAALLLLAAAVLGSIWLGRRSGPAGRRPRLLLQAGTVALVIFAVVGFFEVDSSSRRTGYTETNFVNEYGDVQDVYVYDGEGELVRNAQLFDQWGQPIRFGEPGCIDEMTGNWSPSRSLGYPYCPDRAPFGPQGSNRVDTAERLPTPDPSPTEPVASPAVTADASAGADQPKPAPSVVSASPSRE